MRNISPAVFIGHLAELQGIEVTDAGVRIGAGVSYDTCQAVLDREFPHLSVYWRRVGGWQVRNAAPSAAISPTARRSATSRRC